MPSKANTLFFPVYFFFGLLSVAFFTPIFGFIASSIPFIKNNFIGPDKQLNIFWIIFFLAAWTIIPSYISITFLDKPFKKTTGQSRFIISLACMASYAILGLLLKDSWIAN